MNKKIIVLMTVLHIFGTVQPAYVANLFYFAGATMATTLTNNAIETRETNNNISIPKRLAILGGAVAINAGLQYAANQHAINLGGNLLLLECVKDVTSYIVLPAAVRYIYGDGKTKIDPHHVYCAGLAAAAGTAARYIFLPDWGKFFR